MREFTLAEISRYTGVPAATLQKWAEDGHLNPLPGTDRYDHRSTFAVGVAGMFMRVAVNLHIDTVLLIVNLLRGLF